MNLNEVKNFVKNIDGWLSDNEGELLYDLASKCQNKGVIVEIGSWLGKSTIYLGKGSQNGKNLKVYAVDPHQGYTLESEKNNINNTSTLETFNKNIMRAGLSRLVTPIVKTSRDAAKEFAEPVELIFIDGLHEYENVKNDFDMWYPKVIEGGWMAFHDTTSHAGPSKVVRDEVFTSKHFKNAGLADSIVFAQKTGVNSYKDRLLNGYVLFLKTVYQAGAKINPPAAMKKFIKKIFKKFL